MGSDDAPSSPIWSMLHSNRGSSACMQGGICTVGCAVMATLRQTAPGLLAAGIDPTAEELQQICDVAGTSSWLGSGEPVCTALNRVLGDGQPLLRDVALVPPDLWHAFVSQGETQRDLTVPAVGHVAMVRRIARSLRTTRRAQLLTLPVGDWVSVVPRPKFWRCTHPTSSCEEPVLRGHRAPFVFHLSV